ncbi:MAG: FtsH protease activity modulator HflK [Proteobacteria bacterium]|nr:FtsH protease activity modulator HflK [Pseudomonadota bacterium]
MGGEAAGPIARALHQLRYLLALTGLRDQGLLLVVLLALVGWINSGIYKVQPDEQGVVLRLGRWVDSTGPGLHYHWPYPFERVLLPKVTQVGQIRLGELRSVTTGQTDEAHAHQMLTGDENILEADCVVFWRIKDAGSFLFKLRDPEAAAKSAAESALREVISHTPIQAALSDQRQRIADETRTLLQSLLDAEHSGILVTQVQLQRVDPPSAVIDAFNDVQRARADQQRTRNEAEAYANDILPRARGEAERVTQDALAYKAQVVNIAEGDAKSFEAVYASYAKAKDTTAWRLYLDSVDEMLRKATRVILDGSGKGMAGVVPYLPLDDKDRAAAAAAAKEPAK